MVRVHRPRIRYILSAVDSGIRRVPTRHCPACVPYRNRSSAPSARTWPNDQESRDAPPRASQGIAARRVGKAVKVVYACRGPKIMDSMSRVAMGAFDPTGIPVSSVRQRGAEASWRTV
jgi:hypothetical protein